MKFLVDVCAGDGIATAIRELGHDVKSMIAIDPKMLDGDVLTLANNEDRILVTTDKDFGELVYRAGQAHSGVLLLRLQNARREEKAKVAQAIVKTHSELLRRNFCVFHRGRLRIKTSVNE
ncbi:MAG: DUF5615 family PIN-like protein [Ignavibacteriae bacterium]|nr:DUF5615 family PIN-like protein [Ignavibacteriota bacterium]